MVSDCGDSIGCVWIYQHQQGWTRPQLAAKAGDKARMSRFQHQMIAAQNHTQATMLGGFTDITGHIAEPDVWTVSLTTNGGGSGSGSGSGNWTPGNGSGSGSGSGAVAYQCPTESVSVHVSCQSSGECKSYVKAHCTSRDLPQCYAADKCICNINVCDFSYQGGSSDNKYSQSTVVWLVISAAAGVGCIVLAIWGGRKWLRRRRAAADEAEINNATNNYHAMNSGDCEVLRFKTLDGQSEDDPQSVMAGLEKADKNIILKFKDVEILRELAHGSAGVVSLGRWKHMFVAVKKHFPNNQEMYNAFCVEAKIHAGLHHPNIILLLGICEGPQGELLTLTEFASRGSLYSILHRLGSLKPVQMVKLAIDTAKGMHYLHSVNVLHRDLKSLNLLVDENWILKVADFGTSRQAANTMTQCAGTALWMAPEVVRGKDYTYKADVYSFGIIMWEMLTCETPFNDMTNPYEIMRDVEAGLRPQIPYHNAPKEYIKLMQACWSGEEKDRPDFDVILETLQILWDRCEADYCPPMMKKAKGARSNSRGSSRTSTRDPAQTPELGSKTPPVDGIQ